ncbi:MAG: hypothetical protein RLZZ126_72 [Pseudomonadota bacterium]|jgi:molybdopterin/thiamine biosynthesis adenylyltransferase
MDDSQLLRYSRHILLDDIGIEGQEGILSARALVVGAGGLGSPVALYLASAGVGHITLVDADVVDLTNLQRQIAHTQERVGQLKVDSAKAAMLAINPHVVIHTLSQRADAGLLAQQVPAHSIVFDCTDNFVTRHAINAACVAAKVPLVSGAAIRFDGQVSVYDTRQPGSPCYACLFPPDAAFEETACATLGVLAPLVGIVGTVQAAEGLKLMARAGASLQGRLLMLDALSMQWQDIRIQQDPACPVCGPH